MSPPTLQPAIDPPTHENPVPMTMLRRAEEGFDYPSLNKVTISEVLQIWFKRGLNQNVSWKEHCNRNNRARVQKVIPWCLQKFATEADVNILKNHSTQPPTHSNDLIAWNDRYRNAASNIQIATENAITDKLKNIETEDKAAKGKVKEVKVIGTILFVQSKMNLFN